MRPRHHERGNVFAMLIAGVALVGVLGNAAQNVLQGPVTSIVRVTQKNTALTNMMLSARILLSAATDSDGDGFNEAPAYLVAVGLPFPAGGGLLPSSLGLSLTDPWGTAYGYCTWDNGTTNSSANRLTGDNTATANTQPLVAVIAAGPDKQFQTTCDGFTSGPVSVTAAAGSDDVLFKYSYAEAAASSGGLWTLNATDTAKAELKDSGGAVRVSVDRTGGIINAAAISTNLVQSTAAASDTLSIGGGLLLDTASGTAATCGAGQTGALRLDALKASLEICNGAAWAAFRAAAIPAGTSGQIQYNDAGNLAASGLYWDKATSRLGINTTTPSFDMHLVREGGSAQFTLTTYTNAPAASGIGGNKARGTIAAPTATLLDDYLFNVCGRGYGTTGFSSLCRVAVGFKAAETFTDTAQGAYISFETTATGSVSRTEKMRFTASGQLGIGTTTPKSALHVNGAVQVGTDAGACPDAGNVKIGAIRYNSSRLQFCNSLGWQTVNAQLVPSWGRIDASTVTIAYGTNFDSVTKNGTGDFTVVFTTAQSSANYALSVLPVTTASTAVTCQAYQVLMTGFRVRCFNAGAAADHDFIARIEGP